MRWNLFLFFARTLLLLGLIVPTNSAIAGVPNELRTRLDKVEMLSAETHELVLKEIEILEKIRKTTDPELENQLLNQHQKVLQDVTENSKLRLRTLGGTVDLLSGYGPDSFSDCESAIHETERLVKFLKMERDGILGDDPDAPEELITELGIDKFLERASDYLDFLYMEKKKLSEKKTNKGFVAWFDRQETAVKAALIAAIVSFFGSLMSVVVATIRRRG